MKLSGKTICISILILAILPVLTANMAEGFVQRKFGWGSLSMPAYLLRSYLMWLLIYFCVYLPIAYIVIRLYNNYRK